MNHAKFPGLPFDRQTPAEQLSAVLAFHPASATDVANITSQLRAGSRLQTATVRNSLHCKQEREKPEVLGRALSWRSICAMPARAPRRHTPRKSPGQTSATPCQTEGSMDRRCLVLEDELKYNDQYLKMDAVEVYRDVSQLRNAKGSARVVHSPVCGWG